MDGGREHVDALGDLARQPTGDLRPEESAGAEVAADADRKVTAPG